MTSVFCCDETVAGESCPATASAKLKSQFIDDLIGEPASRPPSLIGLPADANAEEIGTPENAHVFPGIVEAETEPTLTRVIQTAAEREALQVLLIRQGGSGRIDRAEVVGTGVAVAAPGCKPEGRT